MRQFVVTLRVKVDNDKLVGRKTPQQDVKTWVEYFVKGQDLGEVSVEAVKEEAHEEEGE